MLIQKGPADDHVIGGAFFVTPSLSPTRRSALLDFGVHAQRIEPDRKSSVFLLMRAKRYFRG